MFYRKPTTTTSESMNSKIKKHITSGSKVNKVCQDLKSIALAQNEELRKAAKKMSRQYIQKEATQVNRDTIKRNTTPSAYEQFVYLCDRFGLEFV